MDPLETILSNERMLQAWDKVRKNRGCAGTDGQTIADFGANLQANLWGLIQEVRLGAYLPRPLREIRIDRPGRSPRVLAIPAVRDRILQTAVALHLQPVLEAEFEPSSFGYRPGRSVDLAVRQVMRYRQEGYHWVVDADISRYFDEIDQALLMKKLKDHLFLGWIESLVRKWLRTPILSEQGAWVQTKGIAQGSPLSPLLANLYLDEFDEEIGRRGIKLVRYADDFLILCKSREKAEMALELTDELLDAIALDLNEEKTRITHFDEGFTFLGVRFLKGLVLKKPSEAGRKSSSREHSGAEGYRTLGEAIALCRSREEHTATTIVDEEGEGHAPVIPRHGDLRTLYITDQEVVLTLDGGSLCIRRQDEIIDRLPLRRIDQIVLMGHVEITTPLMHACLRGGISIALLTRGGRFHGLIDRFDDRNTALQRLQFQRIDDPPFRLTMARAFVHGKIANSRTLLNRYVRSRGIVPFERAARKLRHLLDDVERTHTLDALRGYEGMAANLYFNAWREALDRKWGFEGRRRRPPPCPVNALLSFGYTLLFNNAFSIIRMTGLNTHAAFLHSERSGHPALASDMIEEFRALVVDAVVLKMIFNEQIAPEQFHHEDHGCRMSPDVARSFIRAFESKLGSRLKRPGGERHFSYRQCLDQQVQKLAASIREPSRPYTPFKVR